MAGLAGVALAKAASPGMTTRCRWNLPPEIADADVDHDQADEDQRHRQFRLGGVRGVAGRLLWLWLGRGAAEGGDIVGRRLALARGNFRRRADAAHLGIVAAVHQRDGRLARVRIRHLLEELLVGSEEVLRLLR